jgi:WD40 repeat protein
VILWQVDGRQLWKYDLGMPGEVGVSISFALSESSLLVSTSSGRLHKLHGKTGQPLATFDVDTGRLRLAISPSGNRLILAGPSGKVQSWDPRRARPEKTWEVGHPVDSLTMASEEVATVGWSSKVIEFWDVVVGRRLMSHELPSGPVVDMRYSEKTGELFVANKSNEIAIVDLQAIRRQLSELSLDFLAGGIPGLPPATPTK